MKKVFFLAAAATIALSSCVKNETVYTDAKEPIAFAAYNTIPTKAITTDKSAMDVNTEFSVFAVYEGKSEAYFPETVFVNREGTTTWGGETPRYWPTTGTLSFAAYSPKLDNAEATYNNGTITGIKIEGINNATAQNDILFSNLLANKTNKDLNGNKALDINFHHALAQVVINLIKADENPEIKIKSVTLNGVNLGGTLDITPKTTDADSEAAWSAETTGDYEASKIADADGETLVKGTNKTLNGVLLVPGNQTKITIVYTINNGNVTEITHVIELAKENGVAIAPVPTWEMGKKYTYNITFKSTEILFEPTVDNWVDVPSKDLTIE